MSIQLLIENYKSVDAQIKTLRASIAQLNERKRHIEQEFQTILETMPENTPGIVVNGVEISLEKKTNKERLTKKQKQEEIKRILSSYNIDNIEEIYSKMEQVGQFKENVVVKIKSR